MVVSNWDSREELAKISHLTGAAKAFIRQHVSQRILGSATLTRATAVDRSNTPLFPPL